MAWIFAFWTILIQVYRSALLQVVNIYSQERIKSQHRGFVAFHVLAAVAWSSVFIFCQIFFLDSLRKMHNFIFRVVTEMKEDSTNWCYIPCKYNLLKHLSPK